MGVKKNDEVITVCNSFYATAGAIVSCGAKPIFVDVNERFQIDNNESKKANTNKTKVKLSQIDIFQEIKKLGFYKAKINLHAEVQAIIHIEVVKEEDKT